MIEGYQYRIFGSSIFYKRKVGWYALDSIGRESLPYKTEDCLIHAISANLLQYSGKQRKIRIPNITVNSFTG